MYSALKLKFDKIGEIERNLNVRDKKKSVTRLYI